MFSSYRNRKLQTKNITTSYNRINTIILNVKQVYIFRLLMGYKFFSSVASKPLDQNLSVAILKNQLQHRIAENFPRIFIKKIINSKPVSLSQAFIHSGGNKIGLKIIFSFNIRGSCRSYDEINNSISFYFIAYIF